ncbi:MAG: glycosyltransferase family 4 protein [Chloroflexi bacterium]|nr:glycosyltransferase family 4 protein [Chloroflexota bacterium]
MLIGIDASRAARAQRTGTENYALQVIRRMTADDGVHRWRLYLQAPPPPGLFPARAETRVIGVPRLWTHIGLGWETWRRPPDALFVPAHVLPIAHPRCTVVTIHDLGHRYFPEAHTPAQRAYLEWSTRRAVRHATRLIAVSAATRDDLVRLYGADAQRIRVVHHGVDAPSDAAPTAPLPRFDPPLAPRWLVAVGTVQPRKNYARLIEAFAAFSRPREELSLVIIGRPGWNAEPIIAQARAAGVIVTGHIPDDARDALVRGAAAYVLPSLYEGFGMPILEAQALGVPVVTSSTSSCPEAAGDGALLVDPLDVRAIAAAMHRVLDDDTLRQSLIARGRANAARFTWERCAAATLSVLEEAATATIRE